MVKVHRKKKKTNHYICCLGAFKSFPQQKHTIQPTLTINTLMLNAFMLDVSHVFVLENFKPYLDIY
jgi:hypothetical protein